MKKPAQVFKIDKNWWKKQRPPAHEKKLIIKRHNSKMTYPLLTVKQVANRLNVGVWSIYDYISSGDLDCHIVGKRKRISEEALEDFLTIQKIKYLRR